MTSASARASRVPFVALGVAAGLSAFEAIGVVVTNAGQGGAQDWRVFVDAGARVGTPALLHPLRANDAFAYTPGYAWLLAPFAHVPVIAGFWIDVVFMIACAVGAALVAARVYDIDSRLSLAIACAWTPVLNAIAVGQNATLGLLLSLVAIAGIARGAPLLAAIPIGMLCYKPTYALPLIGVLVLRAQWRACAIVAAFAAAWYAASVAATGGAWDWPLQWMAMVARYSGADFAFNAVKATSLPALLLRLRLPLWSVASIAFVALVAAAAALRRVDAREAATAACLVGVALSPHAWPYDAALALPMLVLTWVRITPLWRAREAVVLAVVGPLFLVSSLIGFNPQAIVVVGGSAAWITLARKRATA